MSLSPKKAHVAVSILGVNADNIEYWKVRNLGHFLCVWCTY